VADEIMVRWNVPDEIKLDIKHNVAYLIHLIPGWVNELTVTFDSQPSHEHRTTTAYIECDYKYRRVCLTILPTWINLEPAQRKRTLIHEAVHILTAPLQEFFHNTMDEMFSDEPRILHLLQAGWRIANEATTEDSALAIIKSSDASWNSGYDDALEEYGLID
jgi:hypothetical protein